MTSETLVIIPTIRDAKVIEDYANNADRHGFKKDSLFFLILTEDASSKQEYLWQLKKANVEGQVMNQTDRNEFLRELNVIGYQDVFPRYSHAETSFGLFYMHVFKKFQQGIFIDDDTKPIQDIDYFGSHLSNLSFHGRMKSLASDKHWVNVLHNSFSRYRLYPRGYPYSKMNEKYTVVDTFVDRVCLSQGLWTNIPDLDSVRILADGDVNGQSITRLAPTDYGSNFTVEIDNFLTVCSMNLAFTREIIPIFYQFKMDDNPWKIGRFDDIWSGVVAKIVMDKHGYRIINGNPLCEHCKTPRSTFKDLKSEAQGLEINEYFADTLREIDLSSGNIVENARQVANFLQRQANEFLAYNGRNFQRWTELLEKF